jgi:toxin-antitoxin system PIN domain toxin
VLIVDTNVLIYAVHQGARQHDAAHEWLTAALAGPEVVGLPWQSLLGFLRITTNPRVFTAPLTTDVALEVIRVWVEAPTVTTPAPGPRHADVLGDLLRRTGTAGNLTSDAHLAALAIEQGASIASFDRDFARFGVPVVVPSIAG